MTSDGSDLEDVWRREAPHVLGSLVRRYGDFDSCEDAVQEALLAAALQWPDSGRPDNPRGWLVRVASRRLIDARRSNRARADREQIVAIRNPADTVLEPAADMPGAPVEDDTLQLLLMCCHPALSPTSQVSLTLRAVGGLTTAQIAAAFLVPESTMAQRISRAKATLRAAGARFGPPRAAELPDRLAAVLQAIYLIFNEGYTASGGDGLTRDSFTRDAIRLTRELHELLPSHGEVSGLLALMLLTDARTAARTDDRGDLVPLEHQDRTQWDHTPIREGVGILEDVLPRGSVGAFQLQAAIAAVHAEASSWADTDWPQITALYRMLEEVAPSQTVTLNLAVAVGMADGPAAGLALVDPLLNDPAALRHHRTHAVRAHLLEMAGRPAEATEEYAAAARLTTNLPEQRYLNERLSRLTRS
ncbi:MAG: RNA polymerase sigma factor [Nocardioidaceae bacterium]